jgi:hypothetical protein
MRTRNGDKIRSPGMVIARSKALFEMGTVLFTSVPAILEFYQM